MQSEQNDPLQEGPLQEVPVDSCSTLPIPSLAEHLERKSNPGQDRFRLASMQLFKIHGLRKRLHPSAQVDFFRPVWATFWGYLTYAVEDCGGLLFPSHCSLCQKQTGKDSDRFGLCEDCYLSIGRTNRCCLRCSAPLPDSVPPSDRCSHCKGEPWTFDRVFSLGIYRGTLRTTVILMKRPFYESLSIGMGYALAGQILDQSDTKYDYIMPTPQHWLRRSIRRTNSSELMGESISWVLKVPMKRLWLRRNKATRKQGMLGGEQRRLNVKNVFSISRLASLQGKRILLVDDILTSGSTANEMAKVIRKAGAMQIDVAVLARSIG